MKPRRLASGKWQALYKLAGKQYSLGVFGHYADAVKALTKTRREIDMGVHVAQTRATNPTVAEFLDDWFASWAKESNSPNTKRLYRVSVGYLVAEMGSERLKELKRSRVEAARDHMLEGTWPASTKPSICCETGHSGARTAAANLSTGSNGSGFAPRTVKNALAVLAMALDWGLQRDDPLIGRNVARRVRVQPAERVERQILDASAAKRLTAVLEGWERPNMANMLAVSLLTMRRAESAYGGLRWCDVDFAHNRITFSQYMLHGVSGIPGQSWSLVKPDNHKHGLDAIDVPAQVMGWLRRQQEWQRRMGQPDPVWTPLGLVFTTPQGEPIPATSLRREFRRILEVAGLEPRRVHDLRHTGASLALATGVPIADVQRLGGWRNAQTLMTVYAHVLPSATAAAATALADAIKEAV